MCLACYSSSRYCFWLLRCCICFHMKFNWPLVYFIYGDFHFSFGNILVSRLQLAFVRTFSHWSKWDFVQNQRFFFCKRPKLKIWSCLICLVIIFEIIVFLYFLFSIKLLSTQVKVRWYWSNRIKCIMILRP